MKSFKLNNLNPLGLRWIKVIGLAFFSFSLLVLSTWCTNEDPTYPPPPTEASLPVSAIVLNNTLDGAEGIAFNTKGRMFIAGDVSAFSTGNIYEMNTDHSLSLIAALENNMQMGMASDGKGNIYVCDLGPNFFPGTGVNDGKILKVTPSGIVTEYATGIQDPNFILVRPDGGLLVSDDHYDKIYSIPPGGGEATLYLDTTDNIVGPNGMAYSLEKDKIYVSQTFTNPGDVNTFDNRVWEIPLDANGNPGSPFVIAELTEGAWCDGIAVDYLGRIYVAANRTGEIWRIDPNTYEKTLVCDGIDFVASLAFGSNRFNKYSLYATQLFKPVGSTTGTVIWEIPVNVAGAPLP